MWIGSKLWGAAVAAAAGVMVIGAVMAFVVSRQGEAPRARPPGAEPSGSSVPSAARTSIVLVTIDTWRADRLGLTHAAARAPGGASLTPHIDNAAAGGLLFTQAYTTVPLTLPAHVSMMSGRLPIGHRIRTNDSGRVPEELPLVAEQLRRAGLATGAFVGAAVLQRGTGIARGFEEFDDEVGAAGERRCDAVIDRAVSWIDRQGERPFFLWTHLFDPHLDYDPPEPYRSRFATQPYDGEAAYTDACVGRLLDHLAARGRGQGRAALVIAGDHGEGLGDHGERSHGTLLFDSTLHVPLIVRPAGAPGAGAGEIRRIDHPVSTASVAPTLLRLAGVEGGTPAMDVAALVDARGEWTPPAEPVISETLYLRQLLGWSPLYAIRGGQQKVIEAPTVRAFELGSDRAESKPASFDTSTLLRILRGGLTEALRHGIAAPGAPLDEAQRQRLGSLGYVAGGTRLQPLEPVRGIDPMDRIASWDRIEHALEASHRGRTANAEKLFSAVLREDPDNALALKFLGALALERASRESTAGGAPGGSAEASGAAVGGTTADHRLRGSSGDGRGTPNGRVARDTGAARDRRGANADDLRRAIVMHERLVALGLHLADAQANLALAYDRAGRPGDAERAARAAIEVDADHAAARLNLATVLWHAGRADAARGALDELTRRVPGHAGAMALRNEIARAGASGVEGSGGIGPATAERGETEDPTVYDRRGIEAMRARDDRAARAAFERAVALSPNDPLRIERLAALLHRLGDRPAARAAFERVAKLAPERPTAALSLGILDVEEGQAERARRRLAPIRRGWPGAYVAQCYDAEAAVALRAADARQALQDCIAAAPPNDPLAARAREALARLR